MTREELIEGIVSRIFGRKKPKYTPIHAYNPQGKWPEVKVYKTAFKTGDVVEIELNDDSRVHGLVEKKLGKIKNGAPGFYYVVQKIWKKWPEEYNTLAKRQKWAYNNQVVRVIK